MDNYSDAMAAGYGLGGVASFAGAYAQSEALKAQADYQNTIAKINAQFAKIKGKYAIKRGDAVAGKVRERGRQTVGSQRAAAAAQGIDVNDGTAALQQIDTEEKVANDILTVRNNAWREAWGFEANAQGLLNQSTLQNAALNNRANDTLLTGGLQALGYGLKGLGAYGSSGKKKGG